MLATDSLIETSSERRATHPRVETGLQGLRVTEGMKPWSHSSVQLSVSSIYCRSTCESHRDVQEEQNEEGCTRLMAEVHSDRTKLGPYNQVYPCYPWPVLSSQEASQRQEEPTRESVALLP